MELVLSVEWGPEGIGLDAEPVSRETIDIDVDGISRAIVSVLKEHGLPGAILARERAGASARDMVERLISNHNNQFDPEHLAIQLP